MKVSKSLLNKEQMVKKQSEYQEFILWFAMPTYERIESGMETQSDFAKAHNVTETTLSRWKDRPDFMEKVDRIQMKWGHEKTMDVILSIYKSAVKKGNPMSQLLWMQYFKKFVPKKPEEEDTKKIEITVNDIRALIEILPDNLKQKHYANLRELLDDASAVKDAGIVEDGIWEYGIEDIIQGEANNDASDVQSTNSNEVPKGYKTGVCSDMVREVQENHYQSSERWWQEQTTWYRRV